MSKTNAPVVIKVTVFQGQAKINIPKHSALKLNLITEDGEKGDVRYLLVHTHPRRTIRLSPVEMTAIEED